MLRLIEDHIDMLHAIFENYIKTTCDEEIHGRLGHPGRSFETIVYWFDSPGMWVSFKSLSSRFWNAYGFAKPTPQGSVPINFEVNYPKSGVNRRISAAIAQDAAGTTVLVHRGRFRTGSSNLDQETVLNHFREHLPSRIVQLEEPGRVSDVILVGPLQSGLHSIAEFGRVVVELKQRP